MPPLPRMHTMIGDQSRRDDLQAFKEFVDGAVDLLVDDGGHTMQQQQLSLGALFTIIRDGGFYVIEDLHTSFGESIVLYRDGQPSRSYPTGVTDSRHTTYNFIATLAEGKVLDSEYMTDEARQYLQEHLSDVWIFDRENDRKHITALIKKTGP